MNIIDMHCDTILSCFTEKKALKDYSGHISAEKLKAGGALAQCFALFIPTYDTAERYGLESYTPWDLYKALLACYRENISGCSEWIRPALSAEEVRNNAAGGYISSILTVEDGVGTDGKTDRIDEMYEDGVRMLALTWNYENCIGFPNSTEHEQHTGKGLKDFGYEAVNRMNELGMIVDVSHLSEAGFYDVASCSKKPFAASHSCCWALKDHPRNLTDEQLRVLGDKGGVVGINFYDVFLGELNGFTTAESILTHMKHIRSKAGIEALAWGSDFDGIESALEFRDYSGFPQLLSAMEKEFTEDELDRICSGNFLRVFRDQR